MNMISNLIQIQILIQEWKHVHMFAFQAAFRRNQLSGLLLCLGLVGLWPTCRSRAVFSFSQPNGFSRAPYFLNLISEEHVASSLSLGIFSMIDPFRERFFVADASRGKERTVLVCSVSNYLIGLHKREREGI